jgi:hypothetical protein
MEISYLIKDVEIGGRGVQQLDFFSQADSNVSVITKIKERAD